MGICEARKEKALLYRGLCVCDDNLGGGNTKRGRDPLVSHHLIKTDSIRVNEQTCASPNGQEAGSGRMITGKSETTATWSVS